MSKLSSTNDPNASTPLNFLIRNSVPLIIRGTGSAHCATPGGTTTKHYVLVFTACNSYLFFHQYMSSAVAASYAKATEAKESYGG